MATRERVKMKETTLKDVQSDSKLGRRSECVHLLILDLSNVTMQLELEWPNRNRDTVPCKHIYSGLWSLSDMWAGECATVMMEQHAETNVKWKTEERGRKIKDRQNNECKSNLQLNKLWRPWRDLVTFWSYST